MIPKDVKDICELFDCTVCTDVTTYGRPPKREIEFPKLHAIFYIGAYPELSAGLRGFHISPYFFSEKQLERFCRSTKGREIINKMAGETFSDWSTKKQEWNDNA